MNRLIVLLFFSGLQYITFVYGDMSWDYNVTGDSGPANWGTGYDDCIIDSLHRQSPVDLPRIAATAFKTYDDFSLRYLDDKSKYKLKLKNNGHTAKVEIILAAKDDIYVVGGGLPGDKFIPDQFHFHWGSNDNKGAEHTKDRQTYPMEIHLVTYNNRYEDISEAVDKPDGLAVLGFFFEVQPEDNDEYAPLIARLSEVPYMGNATSPFTMNIKSLLGDTTKFYRYDGSLTTPPCHESVTWTVFKDTIKISSTQLETFRNLMDSHQHSMVNNNRPVLLLKGRTVYQNIEEVDTQPGAAVSVSAKLYLLLLSLILLKLY